MRALRSRSKTQPPPAWAIYEALSDPMADQARREWLRLHDGELPPRVLEAVFPSMVIWASLWPDRPDDQIRFDIEDERLTWTLLARHPTMTANAWTSSGTASTSSSTRTCAIRSDNDRRQTR
jgi:hypothetical protein